MPKTRNRDKNRDKNSHQGSHTRNDSDLFTISQHDEIENACPNTQNQLGKGGSSKRYLGK